MPIYNVTPASFDHTCAADGCGKTETSIPHSRLRVVQTKRGMVLVHVSCEQHFTAEIHDCDSELGCVQHAESFNHQLPAWEETSPTRDEASREQVRNVRLLYHYLGLGTQ